MTEMLNTANRLDSVALQFEVRDATHVKGTLKPAPAPARDLVVRARPTARRPAITRSTLS